MPSDRHETQPSAEIVRVERTKRRRECDLSRSVATLCGDGACRAHEMQARVRFGFVAGSPLRRSCVSSARNAGESAICPGPGQPSAEMVRVGCAKCRRECDLSRSGTTLCGDGACRMREMQARVRFGFVRRNPLGCAKSRRECDLSRSRATLCGDRACRMREMQARVRFGFVRRNPLRRSCVSDARNAGESAICPGRWQPSAEIVRVGCAKCRRECDLSRSGATLCGAGR